MKIGIDLGGSHVGVGIIEDAELLISKDKIFTEEDKQNIENSIVKYIDELINEVLDEKGITIDQIEKIGVAAPGTVAGGCITSYNLGLKGFNLQAILEQKYTQPIRVRNDGKCAALAEKKYGAMKDYDDCVFVNIRLDSTPFHSFIIFDNSLVGKSSVKSIQCIPTSIFSLLRKQT